MLVGQEIDSCLDTVAALRPSFAGLVDRRVGSLARPQQPRRLRIRGTGPVLALAARGFGDPPGLGPVTPQPRHGRGRSCGRDLASTVQTRFAVVSSRGSQTLLAFDSRGGRTLSTHRHPPARLGCVIRPWRCFCRDIVPTCQFRDCPPRRVASVAAIADRLGDRDGLQGDTREGLAALVPARLHPSRGGNQ